MSASSASAGEGRLNIWHIVIAAPVATVLGDNIGYLIDRRYGKAVILRYGDRVRLTHEKNEKVEAIAAKYGPLMVNVAWFIFLPRQLNGLVAGSIGMHWATFLGAALWVG